VGNEQNEQVGNDQVGTEDPTGMTIDELAAAAGTTTRRIRSLQTLGLLPHPEVQGRTGVYGGRHRNRLSAVLRLQDEGFSLESLRVLLHALDAGRSLAAVLGLPGPLPAALGSSDPAGEPGTDTAELYGFAELQPSAARRRRRPLLSVVPTTVWDESEAS
jgi:DNA-binding transcriptional MerR regulator